MTRQMTVLGVLWLGIAAAASAQPPDASRRAAELVEQKRYDEAIELLDGVLRREPSDTTARRARAEALRRAGRTDEAREDYEALLLAKPDDVDAWFWLGTIARWRSDEAVALRAFGRVLEQSECHTDALKGRARVRRSAGDLAGTEVDLRQALRCREKDVEATELLAELLVKQGRDADAQALVDATFEGAEQMRRRGDLAASAERWDEAARQYEAAIAAAPDRADLHRRLGDALRERGDTRAAFDSYRHAASLDREDVGSRYWIGVLGTRLGLRDVAMTAYDEMLALRPDDVGALVGKARLLRGDGAYDEALDLLDRALRARPDNGEARVLRGSVLASLGRSSEARREYVSALARDPRDRDAATALDRIGVARALGARGRYDSAEVIEGLEEAGLEIDGNRIRPTRLEYLTEGGEGSLRWAVSDAVGFGATVGRSREAVTNLDGDFVIYDFDVTSASAGLDHRFGTSWRASWRAGGVRYEPRREGTIEDESRFRGEAEVEWLGRTSRASVGFLRAPFIQRGFGADTQFAIFEQTRGSASFTSELGRRLTLSLSGAVSAFDAGDTPWTAGAGLTWQRGQTALSLRLRHDPVLARFFVGDVELDFIDYDVVSLGWRTPLVAGLRTSGEALVARFGETRRTIEEDTDGDGVVERFGGPLDNNTQRLFRPTLAWSPPGFEPLSVGAQYLYDDYDFDTGPYNNTNTRTWSLFAELSGDLADNRVRYAAHYARHLIEDERDPDYAANTLEGRLELKLGRIRPSAGTVSIGLEGRLRDNDLDERFERLGIFLSVPF